MRCAPTRVLCADRGACDDSSMHEFNAVPGAGGGGGGDGGGSVLKSDLKIEPTKRSRPSPVVPLSSKIKVSLGVIRSLILAANNLRK